MWYFRWRQITLNSSLRQISSLTATYDKIEIDRLKRFSPRGTSLKPYPRSPLPSFAWTLGPVLVLLLTGWVRPELPRALMAVAPVPNRLDEVVVLVNGEARVVPRDHELIVLVGDRLEIRQASVSPSLPKNDIKINVYGLIGCPAGGAEDGGREFSTEELKVKFSEAAKGEVFAVGISAKGHLAGVVFIRLVPPELEFAELTINGDRKVVRVGDILHVKHSDRLKVERVFTNVPGNVGVLVQMVQVNVNANVNDRGDVAMRFIRGGRVFASIPLKVSG